MHFLNPIEILNLSQTDFSSLDSTTIKKAKRRILTDIELSDDGLYQYQSLKFTASDCESVIDELEDLSKKEFYYFLANHKLLNNYLMVGEEALFSSFQQESIFQLSEFQEFIAPYFVPRFDKSILTAFKNNDYNKLVSILRTQLLIKEYNINNAFKSLSFELDTRVNSIEDITDKIKNKNSELTKDNVQSILRIVKSQFPIKILNSLPQKNFQSLNNKVATSINYLQLSIDNELGDTKLALELLEYILELEISSISLPTFLQNKEILKKRYRIQLEREQNAPVLKKWATTSSEINRLKTSIEKKIISPTTVLDQLNLLVDVNDLNSLPSYANEIRDDIALMHRALSVAIWNSYSEIEIALIIIKKAINIKMGVQSKTFIEDSIRELEDLKEKKRAIEIIEIEDIIKVITNVNKQISIHGMVHMKTDKIKELLNEIFTTGVISMLADSKEQYLKRKLFTELELTLVKLDAFYSNNFFKKLKPLGNNDGELALKIQNGISGIGFVTKNVANNVGTGLGKANKAMVNNLPPRLVGFIYLIIIIVIISFFSSLAGC